METLKNETPATHIHGTTGQKLSTGLLPSGTAYSLEGTVESWDAIGRPITFAWILVDGQRYRVRAADIEVA